jgi:DNA polymerase elongation subunit (family B)
VLSQVRKMGNDLKKVINQRYSHVEIDIDGIFKMILLLAKKKVRPYCLCTMRVERLCG